MPKYNKNSVFAVSNAGTIPNRVDDLIFFQDINRSERPIWNEFENIMATGDCNAAHQYIERYAAVHGYFGDLYNLMVNRIKAVQNFLVLNETNINNATGAFASFKKPEIFVYQEEPDTPKNIVKDQVWIGPKGYFDEETATESINKMKPTIGHWIDLQGLNYVENILGSDITIKVDDDGYITISGGENNLDSQLQCRIGLVPEGIITANDVWSYWNYYVSGRVDNHKAGKFEFTWFTGAGKVRNINFSASRTANMHANLLDIGNGEGVELFFRKFPGEIYRDLKVGFMVCKTAETTPNQKYVKWEG